MRNAFVAELNALADAGAPLVLLSGDIGNRLFDGFKASFPDQFYNCGIAEANMMSVAAGMAFCGLRPITYTIAPFTTTRCLEQIRVDVCYHNLPVIIAGVGAGLSYAANGVTHQSCEDLAILRCLPNMAVVCPGDPVEVRLALRAAATHPGPVYIRMGKKGEPVIHETEPEFVIGQSLTLREGTDVCLLATGNLLPMALDAARELETSGLSARVESFHTVKPLDEATLAEAFEEYPLVVTIEEHSLLGGLGGAVAEWLVDRPARAGRLLRVGT
ncbi:MAG: transketolase C-terminal domain-containing protein, partial [Armatimonadota bacterium]